MRESWTDDRLDYLNRRVGDGIARVERRLDRIDTKFERIRLREERISDERFYATHNRIICWGSVGFGILFAAFLSVLVTHL